MTQGRPPKRLERLDLARQSITSALVSMELLRFPDALCCCLIAVVHLSHAVEYDDIMRIVRATEPDTRET